MIDERGETNSSAGFNSSSDNFLPITPMPQRNNISMTLIVGGIFISLIIFFLIAALILLKVKSDRGNSRIIEIGDRQAKVNATALLQIQNGVEMQGVSYCESVDEPVLRTECVKYYVLSRAQNTTDVSICDTVDDQEFVMYCKYYTIMPIVARKFYQEAHANIYSNITPSNIALCDQLSAEDREKCRNPRDRIIEGTYIL